MNVLTYNISMLTGLICIGIGAGIGWGISMALLTVGSLVIALTLVGVMLDRKR